MYRWVPSTRIDFTQIDRKRETTLLYTFKFENTREYFLLSKKPHRDERARAKVWHRFGEVWDASSSIKAGAIYGERIHQLAQESEGYVAEDEIDARRER